MTADDVRDRLESLERLKSERRVKRSRAHKCWRNMRQRCGNPNDPTYHCYGGRGLRVCDRWQSFDNFYMDMGEPPPGLTLDRIDNNGNYEPGNCRWATRMVQAANSRNTRAIEINGESMPRREAARRFGIEMSTLRGRLNKMKMTPEDAVTRPIDQSKSRS